MILKHSKFWSFILMMIIFQGLGAKAAEGPLLLSVGAQVGMEGVLSEPRWLFGPYAAFGPEDGLQVRLGLGLGWPVGSLTQLETLILFNFRAGARVYLGGGIGATKLEDSADLQLGLLAAAGLKSLPLGPWSFLVEGTVLTPVLVGGGISLRLSVGVFVSF